MNLQKIVALLKVDLDMTQGSLTCKSAFTQDATQREAKVGCLHENSVISLTHNRPTIHQQFCLSKVKQPLATIRKLSMTSQFSRFALRRVVCKRILKDQATRKTQF